MIIDDTKSKYLEEFMAKLDSDVKERKITDGRATLLRAELRAMSKDRESVQRSKDERRIGRFNKLFIHKLGELSRILQTHGHSNPDEVAEIVRKIKAQ